MKNNNEIIKKDRKELLEEKKGKWRVYLMDWTFIQNSKNKEHYLFIEQSTCIK